MKRKSNSKEWIVLDAIKGVFENERLVLANGKKVSLTDIWRARIELIPYLLFPVTEEVEENVFEEGEGRILYPVTTDNYLNKGQMVYGESRTTRIGHFLYKGATEVVRKPDLKNPHKVKTLGYRKLVLEMKDKSEVDVVFDGNSIELPKSVTILKQSGEATALVPFFDRPSEFINILKKEGIEVYYSEDH
ncbi:hypothetical protein [Vagococcus proximus]|uniref:hypothetical protein n=1 Tax=Vagococcus proximus TaxID=2991417 RepID=UPI0023B7E1FE|nr:hypothetical protein [Vagococcus proximus]